MKEEKVKAFVDGPYGIPPDLDPHYWYTFYMYGWAHSNDKYAGGVGISYMLSTFLSIIEYMTFSTRLNHGQLILLDTGMLGKARVLAKEWCLYGPSAMNSF